MSFAIALAIGFSCCADLPPGFQRSVVAGDLNTPAVIDFLPDGQMLVAQLGGTVVAYDQGQRRTFLALGDVATDGERGLLGMALEPEYASLPRVYVYYINHALQARVSRFDVVDGVADPGSETIIWQNPQPASGDSHHGGNIAFGADGKLYIAAGEEVDPRWAQDLSSQRGKILRIDRDGGVPPDNPFVNEPGADPHIFALGFRNPFRFSIDPVGGALYAGDVGFYTQEEVDRVSRGDNGGWPSMEGDLCYVPDCSTFLTPLWTYAHCDPVYAPDCEAAVILGPVYRGSQFPSDYQGSLFAADLLQGWIRRLVFNANGQVDHDELFATGEHLYTIVDMKVGPDGALYYTCVYQPTEVGRKVYRIAYIGGNDRAPVAVLDASPTHGAQVPLEVSFSGSRSRDPDGPASALQFTWEFGDGDASFQKEPTHVYAAPGVYHVTMTVSDGVLLDTEDTTITVGSPPQVTIVNPPEGSVYRAGDYVFYSGDALDAVQGVLTGDAMSWSVSVVHENHTHPFLGPTQGFQNGYLQIPTTGHPPEDTHYRISLTVTNADGLSTTVARDIHPVVSVVSLVTMPPGIPLLLNGNPVQTPHMYQSVVGFEHDLVAPASAVLDGVEYHFANWLNGSIIAEHDFVAPEGGLAFIALFTAPCPADVNGDGFVSGDDFDYFVDAFFYGDIAADFNHDTFVSGEDFDAFADAFVEGC